MRLHLLDTVIIIPKQRPNVLCRALGPNSAFAGVATALELRLYRVWPSTISRASFVEKVVHAIECLQGDCTLIQQKLMTLYELNYVHAIDQESFLIDLHPSRRVATIRSLIRFLPESFTLSIIQPLITEELVGTSKDTDIDDWTLWHAFSYIDGWSVAYLHSDMRIVTDLIPSFPFHKTKNLTISTHGDCLPFEAGSPHLMVPQTSLSEARNLAAIRSLVIHWRSRDRNFMNDHWNHLLKRTPYLEQLTLEAPHAFDDEGWVGKVMNDVKLSYLESFAIVNLSTTVLELFTFFEAHKDALIEVHLIGERIQNGLPFFLFATKLARWSDHFTLTVTECEDRWEGNDEVMQKYGQYMKINTEVAGSPRDVSDFLV